MTIPHHLCSAWVGPQRTTSANAAMSTVHARTGRSFRYGAIQRRTAVAARVGPASTAPSTVITPYTNAGPPDLAENRAADQPDRPDRLLAGGLGQRIDDVVAGEAPQRQREDADDDDRPADIPKRLPSAAAGKVDRERVQPEHQDDEEAADHVHELHALLRRAELIGRHQVDHAGFRRKLVQPLLRDAEGGSELDDQLVEVDRDLAVAGRDPVSGLVLEHVHELLLRSRARFDEELLDLRPVEQRLDRVRGRLAQHCRKRRAERLDLLGQPVGQRLSDVDVLVELVDDERRDGIAGRPGSGRAPCSPCATSRCPAPAA